MTAAKLEQAWRWVCPNCEHVNIAEMQFVELTDAEKQELKEDHGIVYAQTGDFVAMPKVVDCDKCHGEFDAVQVGDDDD